ncbi:MAG: hypothetical protein LBP38_02665, partial [Desulfovibrio sp.]|nr:hypothetical protein [Desulfovibrio sp.]
GGSFSISSLPLVVRAALGTCRWHNLGQGIIGEADVAGFSRYPIPPASAGGVFILSNGYRKNLWKFRLKSVLHPFKVG